MDDRKKKVKNWDGGAPVTTDDALSEVYVQPGDGQSTAFVHVDEAGARRCRSGSRDAVEQRRLHRISSIVHVARLTVPGVLVSQVASIQPSIR